MTWAEQRRQYGRAIRYGLTPQEAKAEMPKCGKCVTELFSPHRLDVAGFQPRITDGKLSQEIK
jgi:hypothetical protein